MAVPTSTPLIAPTNTPAPTVTVQPTSMPTAFTALNKNDLTSVVRWIVRVVERKEATRISDVIGVNGTRFAGYAMGADFVGHNNSKEIASALEQALKSVEPSCIGYDPKFGTLPDKAMILFKDIAFPWGQLNVYDASDVSGFQLIRLKYGWELVFITPIPKMFMPSNESLLPCPEP